MEQKKQKLQQQKKSQTKNRLNQIDLNDKEMALNIIQEIVSEEISSSVNLNFEHLQITEPETQQLIEENLQELTRATAEEMFEVLKGGNEVDLNYLIEKNINDENTLPEKPGFEMRFDKNGRIRTLTYFPDSKLDEKQAKSEEEANEGLREELMSEEEKSKFNKNFYRRSFNKDHPAEPIRLTTSANETTEEDEQGNKR